MIQEYIYDIYEYLYDINGDLRIYIMIFHLRTLAYSLIILYIRLTYFNRDKDVRRMLLRYKYQLKGIKCI